MQIRLILLITSFLLYVGCYKSGKPEGSSKRPNEDACPSGNCVDSQGHQIPEGEAQYDGGFSDDSAVCEQRLGCFGGEVQYSNEFLCEEQAKNCYAVQICDTKIWCGTRTLQVDVKVLIGEDIPTYEFSNPDGFFVKSCSGAFKVSKRNGNNWVPLTDERPWRTTGPHYLDGVYEELLLDAYLGCDVVACGPIESIGAPKLLEYFQTGTMAPPAEQQELNPSIPDQIPVIEGAISEPPWLFEIEYFNQEDCRGTPVVVTIEVSSFSDS